MKLVARETKIASCRQEQTFAQCQCHHLAHQISLDSSSHLITVMAAEIEMTRIVNYLLTTAFKLLHFWYEIRFSNMLSSNFQGNHKNIHSFVSFFQDFVLNSATHSLGQSPKKKTFFLEACLTFLSRWKRIPSQCTLLTK